MTVSECVKAEKSLIKGRRRYMRLRKWRDGDWYAAWPEIGAEWEAAAAQVSKMRVYDQVAEVR